VLRVGATITATCAFSQSYRRATPHPSCLGGFFLSPGFALKASVRSALVSTSKAVLRAAVSFFQPFHFQQFQFPHYFQLLYLIQKPRYQSFEFQEFRKLRVFPQITQSLSLKSYLIRKR
jgi:hypothetical protein